MFVRKWTKDAELADGEKVLVGSKDVNISDGAGQMNEIRIGLKYIVSGDIVEDFFDEPVVKQVSKRAVKPDREV